MKWTLKKLQKEALKYKSRSEFQKKHAAAYTAATRNGIMNDICSHMEYICYPWTNKELKIEASKYRTRTEFAKKNGAAYKVAHSRNLLDNICSHMEYDHYPWTKKELQKEALKYKTRIQFQKNNILAYAAAQRHGILDSICKHMKYLRHYWTNEELYKIALKYDNLRDLREKNPNVYSYICNSDIKEYAFSHMKKSYNISIAENDLLNIIKRAFPSANRFHHRNIKIKNKLHIKKFEIDIYVPELGKGIEFDGKYWHSFNGLKKSRPHWPDKDLKNYHKIKDDYFLSKGIKILHVKEENWMKNKDKCIKKCLSFLGER